MREHGEGDVRVISSLITGRARAGRRALLRSIAALGVTVAGTSLLSACDRAPSPPPASDKAPAPTSPPATAVTQPGAAAKPTAEQVVVKPTVEQAAPASKAAVQQSLTIGLSIDPGGSVDPRIVNNLPNDAVIEHVYDPLVRRSPQIKLEPVLAESWRWTDDKTLQLKLREGVRFHNGEPFDAESVKWTFDSVLAPQSPFPKKAYLPVNTAVEIIDKYNVKFVLESPFRPLETLLPWFYILPAKAGAELGPRISSTAIGTGQFKLVEYRPNEVLVMERNPDAWESKPQLDRITVRYITENSTRVAALERGEVWMINNLPPNQANRVKSHPDLNVLSAETLRIVYLAMQHDRPPFDDVRVRHAVTYAIDRQALVDEVLQGYGKVASAPLHPLARAYHDSLPPYPYDPNKAKQLLAEAGHAGGVPIKFGSPIGLNLLDKQIAEACTGFLTAAGFKVEHEASEFGTMYPKVLRGEFDIYMLSRTGAFTAGDPVVLNDFYSPTTARNFKYKNDELDAILRRGLSAVSASETELNQLYKQAQEIIWRDLPWCFLYYQPELIAANKRLKGFDARPDEYYYFFDAYVE